MAKQEISVAGTSYCYLLVHASWAAHLREIGPKFIGALGGVPEFAITSRGDQLFNAESGHRLWIGLPKSQ
jgi:hypothetical protein